VEEQKETSLACGLRAGARIELRHCARHSRTCTACCTHLDNRGCLSFAPSG